MSGTQTKDRLLGMPFGTAMHRLRKSLLFELAGRLEMLGCYRCGNPIETIDEFSIEHKDPWQIAADPVAKFFDVANLSFSHYACNVGAAKKRPARHGTGHMVNKYHCSCDICREFMRKKEAARYTPERRRAKYLRTGT